MTRVTFAVDHVTDGGRTYKQGTTHEVNAADARELIHIGRAVDAGPAPEPAPSSETDASGESGASKTKKG